MIASCVYHDYMSVVRIIFCFFTFITMIGGRAWADDDYIINNIMVSSDSTDAAAAREIALTKGQRDAFLSLLQLLSEETLPIDINDDLIIKLVKSFEINLEKITGKTYSATISVKFDKALVDQLFTSSGIYHNALTQQPALIIPVMIKTDGTPVLWDVDNIWRMAWEQYSDLPNIGPLKLMIPQGDLADIQSLSAAQAVQLKPSGLAAMARNYHTDNVVVVVASDNSNGQFAIKAVWLKGIDMLPDINSDIYNDLVAPSNSEYNDEVQPQAFNHVIEQVVIAIEQSYKKLSQISGAGQQQISIRLDIGYSLDNWRRFKRGLEKIPFVSDIKVKELSVDKALLVVSFQGNAVDLAAALALQNIHLLKESENLWTASVTNL